MAAGHERSGGRALSRQADELPDALPDLQEPAAELSRPADPATRVRQRLPQREVRRAARPAARARPLQDDAHIFCTLDQVEDEIFLCLGQVDRLVRADLRLRARLRVLDPARGAARRRRDRGTGPRAMLQRGARSGRAFRTASRRAAARSTARRSTSSSRDAIGRSGRGRPSSSTSICPSGSSWSTSARTTSRTGR